MCNSSLPANLPHVRAIGAVALRKHLGREKGQCTWCGQRVPKGRVTWCSKACVTAFTERYMPSQIRHRVKKRDKGVCAQCGDDTKHWLRLWRLAKGYGEELPEHWNGHRYFRNRRGRRNLQKLRRYRRLSPKAKRRLKAFASWDADHIVPVEQGGAVLGLDNIQTLCSRCHKRKTAQQAAEKAAKRRAGQRSAVLR